MENKNFFEHSLHSYSESGVKGLVKLMQLNYTMRNLPFVVTYKSIPTGGNIIIVDNRDPND
jgi:hypothetical protein